MFWGFVNCEEGEGLDLYIGLIEKKHYSTKSVEEIYKSNFMVISCQ